MFDTHAHLNFKRFRGRVDAMIADAQARSVSHIVIPGTDIESSKRAVTIAQNHEGVYAAVGIHPHHAKDAQYQDSNREIQSRINTIEQLLANKKVVAVGEIGLDRHVYTKTKYQNYTVDDSFIKTQRKLLVKQINLAIKHEKSLILHNREATRDLIDILEQYWDNHFVRRAVFHCCEPDIRLFSFAKKNHVFIGVDGDITYDKKKQSFVKNIPLDMIVLETDAPFLLPEPLRSEKKYPNNPANLPIVAYMVAELKDISIKSVQQKTAENARSLFRIS